MSIVRCLNCTHTFLSPGAYLHPSHRCPHIKVSPALPPVRSTPSTTHSNLIDGVDRFRRERETQ